MCFYDFTSFLLRFGEFGKIGEFCMIFSETPNMSEPNTELAAQFEKEDAERKAEIAARKSGGGGEVGWAMEEVVVRHGVAVVDRDLFQGGRLGVIRGREGVVRRSDYSWGWGAMADFTFMCSMRI